MYRLLLCKTGELFVNSKPCASRFANLRNAFDWVATHVQILAFNIAANGDVFAWVAAKEERLDS